MLVPWEDADGPVSGAVVWRSGAARPSILLQGRGTLRRLSLGRSLRVRIVSGMWDVPNCPESTGGPRSPPARAGKHGPRFDFRGHGLGEVSASSSGMVLGCSIPLGIMEQPKEIVRLTRRKGRSAYWSPERDYRSNRPCSPAGRSHRWPLRPLKGLWPRQRESAPPAPAAG